MALATLIAITLMCIAWSLWIRRVTWSCRWEVAATLNIALQGLAVLLMSPLASETQRTTTSKAGLVRAASASSTVASAASARWTA